MKKKLVYLFMLSVFFVVLFHTAMANPAFAADEEIFCHGPACELGSGGICYITVEFKDEDDNTLFACCGVVSFTSRGRMQSPPPPPSQN